MLQLKNTVKDYVMGDTRVEALRGVSLAFRKSEFVSILGPSGCGKTTLLNIIGGLDRYTSGDLIINGISTKEYKDVDWDIYRNNSIGFVFQNYNLISHQTVLSNVELAMTLAGTSRAERRKRAAAVLESVGLGDQLDKKPTQMSGGQMQRVAIARALVNNPDILLADEPTGALDSETSLQIMELLKEIAKNRLVIMVTHNSDLAEKYSTRVIRLLDGKVISDSQPYTAEDEHAKKEKRKKISMSLPTALALSARNLMTKKTRTILTAFAGSIGIIGIALIMSLSSGMQGYVKDLERDTLSTYPIQLESTSIDITGMMTTMMGHNRSDNDERELDKIYANKIITHMASTLTAQITKNNLALFMEHLEGSNGQAFRDVTNSIQYGYDIDLQIYRADTTDGILQVNPSEVMAQINQLSGGCGMSSMGGSSCSMGSSDVWDQLLGNDSLLQSQYDVLAGNWPAAYNEIVLVVDEHNELSDAILYSLGLLDPEEFNDILNKVMKGENVESDGTEASFSYEDILSLTFKLVLNTDYYVKENGKWVDKRADELYMKTLLQNAPDLKVVGILRPSPEASASAINGSVGYTAALTDYVINAAHDSEIAKEQLADPDVNVFTGFAFHTEDWVSNLTMEDVGAFVSTMAPEEQSQIQAMFANMTEEQIITFMAGIMQAGSGDTATYEDNLSALGIVDLDNPNSINLYPKDFDAKEALTTLISEYNQHQEDAGHSENVINYTDIVGLMTSSISSIINIISYVLIAFVAISLIVSSIMIAIITYISVLERTKEIGILRSIGASKKDITRVFNAETIIEGFVAGGIGILVTLLLNIPINIIIKSLTDITGLSALPLTGALGLIALSVVLTVIAGLIPSRMAAKKDPVEALRSE